MPQSAEVSVIVVSRVEYIDPLHAIAEEMAKIAGFAEDECFHFALAVREAATNAVMHGNGADPEKSVTVTFELEPDHLSVVIRDEGTGFDYDHSDDPTLPENRCKTSGRGLLLIRSFVDEVSYDFATGRGAALRMVKRRGCENDTHRSGGHE